MPRAMVLCAGHGTRLRPLTLERPKPLLPFGDRTLLEHVLASLDETLRPALVNAHHLAEVLLEFSKSCADVSQVLVEHEILGTAGGVRGALAVLGPAPVLVTNGDVLARVDGVALLSSAPEQGLSLAVAPRPLGSGTVGIGSAGEIVRLRGERFGVEVSSGDYLGTMALGAGALARLPRAGCLIGDLTLPLLRDGAPVVTFGVAGRWFEPGDGIAQYLDEHLGWLEERFGSRDASFVGAGAKVEPAVTLVSSVIGAGARVTGEGTLDRVVVWPGASVRAPLRAAVVTTAGTVVPSPNP
ncbi:MAG TPA: sugar phosphate nucleotidyltransferase [Polyangiaceae bacterium]|nr:sugar phosphate nucleotidyltransferase [Polyangiaceae bacterium]